MMFSIKTRKIFLTVLIFLSVSLFANSAHALTGVTIKETFDTIFGFVNINIVAPIKNDFCRQYIISLSGEVWKPDELRAKLGKKVCTSYSVSEKSFLNISKDTLQSLEKAVKISTKESPSTSSVSVNNPTPDVYVPHIIPNDNVLDIGQILSFTNNDRKSVDSTLVNLKQNSTLQKIAEIRVKDMFAQEYFEHNSPTGDNASKEAAKNGYSYITIGENIALGNFEGSRGLVTSWMNSPGHRANILNKNYTEIGISAISGTYKGQKVWISAQIFGKPLTGCTSPDKVLKDKIDKYKVSADNILRDIQTIDAELKTISQSDTQKYNAKIAERNTLAKLYNDLATEIKTSVAEYNAQTATYNICIKTI